MQNTHTEYRLSQLDELEAESIFIIREVAAESERPVLLFSGGKDSLVMLHLAVKAFAPARMPFPVMHVDTGHNFPEVLEFRDRRVAELGVELIVASVPDAIERGLVQEEPNGSRNRIQTPVLLEALEKGEFTAAFGGARRDEERARAKERVFSFRDDFGQWDPKNQRPELWSLYNARIHPGEHMRVFPLSNWTELDIWDYIAREKIELPSHLLRARARMDLLRFATAGSVDDGKSTLIGRLLYDTKTSSRTSSSRRAGQPRARGDGVRQPRAAHRRPARRARAGHHDRRGLPLLRHAEAQVHHRRHARATSSTRATWSRARRRRPGDRARRRAQGRGRAVQAARFIAVAAAHPPPRRGVNKMDLVDYDEEVFEQIRAEFHRLRDASSTSQTSPSSRSPR
jgi:sulfate adenylyltransferase small subunit